MQWTSIIAIYSLFWVLSAFIVMPFGVRTHHEAGIPTVPGQAESAPANFQPKRIAWHTTLVSIVLFGLFYANYIEGWITPDDFLYFGNTPSSSR